MHRRPVYIYLLNVPSFSSRYFNKIKRTSRLGRLLALSLEILLQPLPPLVASPVLLQGSACLIITLIRSLYIKHPFQKDASDILCVGKFWEASEKIGRYPIKVSEVLSAKDTCRVFLHVEMKGETQHWYKCKIFRRNVPHNAL